MLCIDVIKLKFCSVSVFLNSWSGCCWHAVCPGLLLLTSTRWCNKVSFSHFPGGKTVKAFLCCGCAASAEGSERALHSEHVHWELNLPVGFFALGFSSQFYVRWGEKKRGGGNAALNLNFLERESKTPAVNAVSNPSDPLVGLLFVFLSSSLLPSLSRSVKSRACVTTRSCRIGERLPWMF